MIISKKIKFSKTVSWIVGFQDKKCKFAKATTN